MILAFLITLGLVIIEVSVDTWEYRKKDCINQPPGSECVNHTRGLIFRVVCYAIWFLIIGISWSNFFMLFIQAAFWYWLPFDILAAIFMTKKKWDYVPFRFPFSNPWMNRNNFWVKVVLLVVGVVGYLVMF